MIKYPEVKHKLPTAFEEIIKVNKQYEQMLKDKIILICELYKNREEKLKLRQACELYIQKQKGSEG